MVRSIGGLPAAGRTSPCRASSPRPREGREFALVWHNQIGGTTFRIGTGRAAEEFVKVLPHAYGSWISGEAERLTWASRYARVPEVLGHGTDDDGVWLHTRACPGGAPSTRAGTTNPGPRWSRSGEGLRALHDALPVDDCPFAWATADRLDRARSAVVDVDADAGRGPGGLGRPPADRIVVCHGDPCTPNTLIGADRRWSGHVDLDAMGVADRWADIAVATMALGWNYGPGWEPLFHRAYGLPDDPERTAWYRALWNTDADDVGPATS